MLLSLCNLLATSSICTISGRFFRFTSGLPLHAHWQILDSLSSRIRLQRIKEWDKSPAAPAFPSVLEKGILREYTADSRPAPVCGNQKLDFISFRLNIVIMPSMRQSYTVTVPEDPPAAAFPFHKQDLRRKSPQISRSMLVSTFVGLLINQAKVSVVNCV